MAPAVMTIGRPLDISYPTNKAIVVVALTSALAIGVLRFTQGVAVLDASKQGFSAAIIVFLSWAISREIDPDNQWSAFIAPAIAVTMVAIYGSAGGLYGFWALLALRFINRTPGPTATGLDTAIGAGLGLILVNQSFWLVGIAMAGAFALDAALTPINRKQWAAAGFMLVGTALLTGIPNATSEVAVSGLWIMAISGIMLLVLLYSSRDIKSVGDRGGTPLSCSRVQAAQGFAFVAAFLTILVHGENGFAVAAPVWTAMIGIGIFRIGLLTRASFSRSKYAQA
jgi:hypothetical protein